MKAAVYKGNQQLRIEEIPTPTPGPGQVLIKVKYCAICGTDVHGYLYDAAPPGTVMGHEYCGTVVELGPGVSSWNEGDRVVGGGGTPPPGKAPKYITDPRFSYLTMGFADRPPGAYAEYVLMEEWAPVPVPDGVSDEAAAMCEPCAIAVHAVRISQLRLGDSVAVLGAGPIGLLCIQAAMAAGAGAVFVSEPSPTRGHAALDLGADAVIDPTKEDAVARMVSLTGGSGPRVVFDCAGARSSLDQAMNMTSRHGQVVLVALAWEHTSVLPAEWITREVNLQASFGSRPEDWRIALDLLRSGKITVEPMLNETDFIPLDAIQEAFESLIKPTTQLQMVVKP
jgi:(R,R)-butanediol dehydrogenase/meso-butanediol dehydrogenase/diacetyl reductase